MIPFSGIERAIWRAGDQATLACALGVTQQNISIWSRRGYVPPKYAVRIYKILGVPLIDLLEPELKELLTVNEK